jgi:hypothetical protein
MNHQEDLFAEIDSHFLAPEQLRRAELLGRHGRSSAEGWFKAELMLLLESMAKAGRIDGWRADVPITEDTRQRCDLRIVIGGQPLWLEVKTLVQPGQVADTGVMTKGGGFADDLVKLMRVRDGEKGVLLFIVPRPEPAQWADLLASYARRIAPLGFSELSDISAYPAALYVCKLALKEAF